MVTLSVLGTQFSSKTSQSACQMMKSRRSFARLLPSMIIPRRKRDPCPAMLGLAGIELQKFHSCARGMIRPQTCGVLDAFYTSFLLCSKRYLARTEFFSKETHAIRYHPKKILKMAREKHHLLHHRRISSW